MKKLYNKEKNRAGNVVVLEDTRKMLKYISYNQYIPYLTRWNSLLELTELPKAAFKARIVGRCILSKNRKRFNAAFKFSRLSFLRLARSGFLNGVSKAVW